MPKFTRLIQALLLAVVLGTGFAAVWALLALWVIDAGSHVIRDQATPESLRVLRDGTVLVQHRSPDGRVSYRTLDCKPATVNPDADAWYGNQLVGLLAHPPRPEDDFDWSHRIRVLGDGRDPATFWYFVDDGRAEGSAYFVGYDSESKALVGYVGTAGFREQPLPEGELFPFAASTDAVLTRLLAFPSGPSLTAYPPGRGFVQTTPPGYVAPYDAYVLGRDENLYHVNLRERTVETALHGTRIDWAALALAPGDTLRGTSYHPVVRTDDAVLLLDVHGRERVRYPVPEPLRGRTLTFSEATADYAVMFANGPDDGLTPAVEYDIFRVRPDGNATETRVSLEASGYMRPFRFFFGAILPSPAAVVATLVGSRSPQLVQLGLAATRAEATARALGEFWPALAIAQVVAVGLAVLCFRRQVRYGASKTERIVWPLFVLLLGLPGWVGYRFGRSWPDLETCETCGAVVPADRVTCVRCSHEFPRPALKGTEVFA